MLLRRPLFLDTGPPTLVPLIHVPLLHQAPRRNGEYRVLTDSLGDFCHFYGDFSKLHIYAIVTTRRKRIVADSIDYFDKQQGLFSVSLATTLDSGEEVVFRVKRCEVPLHQLRNGAACFPHEISIAQFSPGCPDALRFHFQDAEPKFKFSNNLAPSVPEDIRLGGMGHFDLHVEYIGKAVGKDGAREVADRFGDGHSTESLILNELAHKRTNLDAFAVLYRPGILEDREGAEATALTFNDVIDALEKSLISALIPNKNKQSLNFPNDGSRTVQTLREARISQLLVTLRSPKDYGMLFTANASPERTHHFPLDIPE